MVEKEKKVEQTLKAAINSRFLHAVASIVQKHKAKKIKPDSERDISTIIGSDPSIIAKIRKEERGVTLEQMAKFCAYFDLDANYFFKSEPTFSYTLSEDRNPNFNRQPNEISDVKLFARLLSGFELEAQKMEQMFMVLKDERERLEKQTALRKENSELKVLLTKAREEVDEYLKKYISLLEERLKEGTNVDA